MRMQFFAHDASVVIAAIDAHPMRKAGITTMGAETGIGHDGFPIGPAVSLVGMAETFLGNWHARTPLMM